MNKKTINEEVARMRKIMGLNEMYDDQEDLNDPAYDPWIKGGKYPVAETEHTNAYKEIKRPTDINLDEYFDEVDATTPYGAENGVDPNTVPDSGGTNVFMAEKHLTTNDEHDQFEKQMMVQNFLNMLDSNVHELDMLKNIMYERGLYNSLLKYKSGKLKDSGELFSEIRNLVEMLELPEQPNVKVEMLQLLDKISQPEMATEPVAEIAAEAQPSCPCEEMDEYAESEKFNQPDYKYYVINKTLNKILTGFEFKEDAVSHVKELASGGDDPKNYVVSAYKYAKMRGLDPENNESWGEGAPATEPAETLAEDEPVNPGTPVPSKPVKAKPEVYFKTFSGAVQYALADTRAKGYEINDDDVYYEINMKDNRRPKEGKTTHLNIQLYKNGKEQRKFLHIQVYNMGNTIERNFELNYYVS